MNKCLSVGRWYRDKPSKAEFKLLAVNKDTLRVVDQWGNVRIVNRMAWEIDFNFGSIVRLKKDKQEVENEE